MFFVSTQSVEKGRAVLAECEIKLFGVPEVTLDGKEVKLGAALPLLATLILQRSMAMTAEELAHLLRPFSQADDPVSFLKKRKQKLRTLLKMSLPNTLKPQEIVPVILEQASVDVAEFDDKIASSDSRDVREAVALRRRGPLLDGWSEPEIVTEERRKREEKYQTALWRLIQEDRRENPQEAVRSIDLLLDCPGLPEKSVGVLREDRLALDHDIFRLKAAGGGKTTQSWRPPRLPSSPTALIGRDAEIEVIQTLLSAPGLVTLVGTAGVGKTRLALAAAHRLQQSLPHGAAFADFSAVFDASQMFQQVALSLGLAEDKQRSWLASSLAVLEDKNLLLVWDNCEHLVEACAELAAEVLTGCPAVRILATSREPLRAYGERRCPVSALREADAVTLFSARAKLVQIDFCLTPDNTPLASKICRDLDGLPLAVELAASLTDTQTLPQIASQLDRRFDLLSDGPRTGAVRHRSLRAAFDVSYDLLKPAEQALFRRIGVFAGSFSAQAAAAVSAEPAPDTRLAPRRSAALLAPLVRKSLVDSEPSGAEVRYRQLETVRQYARERLRGAGEEEDTHDRHRLHFLGMAEEAEPYLKGPDPKTCMDALDKDITSLRGALEWRTDEVSVRIACALLRFWKARGYLQESRRWLEQGARTEAAVPDSLRARALNGAGVAAFVLGDFQNALKLHEESLSLSRRTGNAVGEAEALNGMGSAAAHLGNYDEANNLILAGLAFRRRQGDGEEIASSLSSAAMVANYQCRYEQAREMLQENLLIVQQLEDAHGIASGLYNLGIVAYYQVDLSAANTYFEKCLALWRPLNDEYSIAKALSGLGEVALRRHDFESAQSIYAESLRHRKRVGDKYGTANSLNGLGEAAMCSGDYESAAALLTESMSLRRLMGDTQSEAHSLHNLGQLALRQNDAGAAQAYLSSSMTLMRQNKDPYGIAHALESLACTLLSSAALSFEQAQAAARMLGAADSLRTVFSSPRFPNTADEHRKQIAALQAQLGSDAFAAAWAAGQAMTWEEAVSDALGENGPLEEAAS